MARSFAHTLRRVARWLCIGCMAGCAVAPEEPAPPPEIDLEATEGVEQAPPPDLEPAAAPVEPAPARAPQPLPPPPPPPRVLVLVPEQLNGFAPTLDELAAELEARGFAIEVAAVGDSSVAVPAVDPERATFVIAVGSEAARVALDELGLPTVFCQIPDQDFAAAGAYGVATMPPLALQLRAWKQLDPTLDRIALILSRDEYLLAAQALQAAGDLGIVLELRTATSDQEALYLFRRLAAQVDGLWLLPDNAILSPRVLREMLEYATSRGVQSLAFTPALLEWGALVSVSGTPANVARTISDVVARLAAGDAESIPPVTPLSELEVRVNAAAAAQLGLAPPASAWIVGAGS